MHKRLTPSERDGRWFKEWVEYGLEQLEESLAKHAAFDQYLTTHPTEESCPNSTTPNSPSESSEQR